MKMSVSGVLLRVANRLESINDSRYLALPVRQLYADLKELKSRHADGYAQAAYEFFEICTDFEAESGIDQ